MTRSYYSNTIESFISQDNMTVLGLLVANCHYTIEDKQNYAWLEEIKLLKESLKEIKGHIFLEFSIPRMGKRADCVIIIDSRIIVVEFKIGADTYDSSGIDQVLDYALDLKNFHEGSHERLILPILVSTEAPDNIDNLVIYEDLVAIPLRTNGKALTSYLSLGKQGNGSSPILPQQWENSQYKPTPTIIEAAQALYRGHKVEEISRSDAGAINLSRSSMAISKIIHQSKVNGQKSICFLTGVPGAGKTLAGLSLANSNHNVEESEHAVFLSGNGPLVEVLREALARDDVRVSEEAGERIRKTSALTKAKAFIQNIHHFRDDGIESPLPPTERVVVFDEAQRAWTLDQTARFMKEKKGRLGFSMSEPEFLISVMNRHAGWATIICLIGGGQEINTGEAGLPEWFNALKMKFPDWKVYVSNNLNDHEYTRGLSLFSDQMAPNLEYISDLHLSVSVRSFRSEKVSALVKAILDSEIDRAKELYAQIVPNYPIFITRDLHLAKKWVIGKSRGSERYGLLASSGAIRLRAHGIHVKADADPKVWFLNDKTDIRSSFYMEDVATEFLVQGLELDWTLVAWDGDLRYVKDHWETKSFRGAVWQEINSPDRRLFLINAYRVLLTRARQGMAIFVPPGSNDDHTRLPEFYDGTYEFLKRIGLNEIPT